MRFALAQLGDPYVWAAAGPDQWDCSGLTMAAWAAAGRSLPHYSAAQYLATKPVTQDRLRPGDLVFWAGGSGPDAIFHVALYLGAGQVVQTAVGVAGRQHGRRMPGQLLQGPQVDAGPASQGQVGVSQAVKVGV